MTQRLDFKNLQDAWKQLSNQPSFSYHELPFKQIVTIKRDCKYYSGNYLLPCAVNTNCQGCNDYIVEE